MVFELLKNFPQFRYDLNKISDKYAVQVMNKFKGLDLVNSVPEELWMEVHNIVQEAVNKTFLEKRIIKQAKLLSEEALQIAGERRDMKSKGERERCIQLNAEFQRIAKRDKKDFFNEQCIKIEENNRKGKISSGKLEISREHFAQRWAH